jgi:hypothetical protein
MGNTWQPVGDTGTAIFQTDKFGSIEISMKKETLPFMTRRLPSGVMWWGRFAKTVRMRRGMAGDWHGWSDIKRVASPLPPSCFTAFKKGSVPFTVDELT